MRRDAVEYRERRRRNASIRMLAADGVTVARLAEQFRMSPMGVRHVLDEKMLNHERRMFKATCRELAELMWQVPMQDSDLWSCGRRDS